LTQDARQVEIRTVDPEEFSTFTVNHYAFGATPSVPSPGEREKWLRYAAKTIPIAAFVDGKPVATATLPAMTQNVRGLVLPMTGVGGVASLPEGRRQGYVRQLMVFGFELMRAGGSPVSSLYPFRESFYERLGYAGFPTPRYATLNPADLAALVRMPKPGEIEQVPMSEGFEAWRAFLERLQPAIHGFSLKDLSNSVRLKDDNVAWVATVREAGTITGAMTFRITGYTRELRADTFYAPASAARYQLLDWIGRHVDQVKTAHIKLGPRELPELWYRDLAVQSSTVDDHAWPAPMGRIISVTGLDGIGAGDASITVTLIDDLCPWNGGVWTLTGNDGRLVVSPGEDPRCTLTIQGLSALVYCGHDPADFVYRGWGDPDASAREALRTLFPPAFPVLHEEF
jgi:predicted acetyltransferase